MFDEQSHIPEGERENDLARGLAQHLASGGSIDLKIKEKLLALLSASSGESTQGEDPITVTGDTTSAAESIEGKKIDLEEITPRSEEEGVVLRAVKAVKMLLQKPNNHELTGAQRMEADWYQDELDKKNPTFHRAMMDLLRDYGRVIDISDVEYFLDVLDAGEREHFATAFGGTLGVPKGFSEGELLEIRRELITRYLNEIPEDKDDPYNSPQLWYGYLIRFDVYSYLRGENVRSFVDGAIKDRNHDTARPERAAYVREVLKDTLQNLDGEKAVVDQIKELCQKYSKGHSIRFVRGDRGRGNIVVEKLGQNGESDKVVETIYPKLPLIANKSNVLR